MAGGRWNGSPRTMAVAEVHHRISATVFLFLIDLIPDDLIGIKLEIEG